MKKMLLILMVIANAAMAADADIQAPAFNNWTTESLKQIFIPPTRITRVHGNIKTVTFVFPADARGSALYAYQCFNLLFLFLFGPNIDHKYELEDGGVPGVISEKNIETGYVITRDREAHDMGPDVSWRYHFTVTQNETVILTAALIEPDNENLGPRFILHITR